MTANEMVWLKKNNLKVALKNSWMPIELKSENKNFRGLSIDYLKRLSNIFQVNFRLE